MEAGDLGPETLESCEKLVSLSPQTAIFHGWLGMIQQAQQRLDAALESFRVALSITPDSVKIRNSTSNQTERRVDPLQPRSGAQSGGPRAR